MKNPISTQPSDKSIQNARSARFTDPSFISEVARIINASEQAYLTRRTREEDLEASRHAVSISLVSTD